MNVKLAPLEKISLQKPPVEKIIEPDIDDLLP